MPHINRHWMPAECHFSIYLFVNPPSLSQGGNEGLERLCSFPGLILNPVLSGSPHMANYFLTVSGTVLCLDLIHCFPSKSENYFNYQLLLMKSWEWGTWFTTLLEKQDIHMTKDLNKIFFFLKKILKSIILVAFLRATESAWKPFQGSN